MEILKTKSVTIHVGYEGIEFFDLWKYRITLFHNGWRFWKARISISKRESMEEAYMKAAAKALGRYLDKEIVKHYLTDNRE